MYNKCVINNKLQDSLVDERYNPGHIPLSSFKRAPAPAMGGRAAEQRRQDDKRARGREKRVGQLDEKNLKRAANRYGTLPKGARIGAYLESLRGAGMTPEPVNSDESGHDTLESTRSGHTDPGGRTAELQTPVMARSNSSHGGFPGNSFSHSLTHSIFIHSVTNSVTIFE